MVLDKLIGILQNYTKVNKNEIRDESRIREDLTIKSVDIVNLIVSLEEEFDIEIDMSQINPAVFQTVKSVCALIESLTEKVSS